jgi:hypothetical protein
MPDGARRRCRSRRRCWAAAQGGRVGPAGDASHHRAVRVAVPLVGRRTRAGGLRVTCWWVLWQQGLASATRQAFDSPGCCSRSSRSRCCRPAGTSSATRRPAARPVRHQGPWARASTWSGPPSTPTSTTPTACPAGDGWSSTWAASTSTPCSRSP